MANIVLAHGILGFGMLPFGIESRYFNGVAASYRGSGHNVLVPTVDLLGSLDDRSEQLNDAIETRWPTKGDLIVIAHSMGGLDMRRVVARSHTLAERVRVIVAIATPHFGSPVADAVLDPSHPLRSAVPTWLLASLGRHGGAIEDLKVRGAPHDPDVAGISYFEIGCDTASLPSTSPLFDLAKALGNLSPGGNDGVVALSSAKAPGRDLAAIWPVDHLGAIGWPSGSFGIQAISAAFSPPSLHLRRYADLLTVVL